MTTTRDSIEDVWGPGTPYVGDWPARVDERTVEEPGRWVQSTCILCSNGCGMDIDVKDGRIVGVRGRAVATRVKGAFKAAGSSMGKGHVGTYLGMIEGGERDLAESLTAVAHHYRQEPDMESLCRLLASWSLEHVEALKPLAERYSEAQGAEPDRLRQALFHGPRSGGLGLLRDLHDLWLLANEVHLCWEVLSDTAKGLRDKELESACATCGEQTDRQIAWLRTRIDQAAPQALIVPS